jgi:hypothetical protein
MSLSWEFGDMTDEIMVETVMTAGCSVEISNKFNQLSWNWNEDSE